MIMQLDAPKSGGKEAITYASNWFHKLVTLEMKVRKN